MLKTLRVWVCPYNCVNRVLLCEPSERRHRCNFAEWTKRDRHHDSSPPSAQPAHLMFTKYNYYHIISLYLCSLDSVSTTITKSPCRHSVHVRRRKIHARILHRRRNNNNHYSLAVHFEIRRVWIVDHCVIIVFSLFAKRGFSYVLL